jgi:hypothetical protein
MRRWRWALLLLALVVVGWYLRPTMRGTQEDFTINSVAIDPTFRYPNGYYTELDNASFAHALKQIFHTKCDKIQVALRLSEWKGPFTPDQAPLPYQQAYAFALQNLRDMVKNARALHLAHDNPKQRAPLQIVEDDWTGYYVHISGALRIDVDLVFYREGKHHGKHVSLSCIMAPNGKRWKMDVVSLEVRGIVPEDQIAMAPVTARDPSQHHALNFDPNPYTFENHILMSNEEVIAEVQRRLTQHKKNAEAEVATRNIAYNVSS